LKAFEREGIEIAHTPRPAPAAPSPAWTADDEKAEIEFIDRLVKRNDELEAQKAKPRRRKPDPA
jgi:hypothetical protein